MTRTSQRGATMVVTAIALLAVFGFTSMTVDVAVLYVKKQAHVGRADAAALAGADAYLHSTQTGGCSACGSGGAPTGAYADAANAATLVARLNGDPTLDVTFPAADEISVYSSEDAPLFFARVFGIGTSKVGAHAVAVFDRPNEVSTGLRPFGIDMTVMSTVTYGSSRTLKQGTPGGTASNGDFLALALDANGGKTYDQTILTGAIGAYTVAETILSEPGKITGPTDKAIGDLIATAQSDPEFSLQAWGSTSHPVSIANPRVIAIPIVDWNGAQVKSGGRTQLTIAGFAMFYVESASGGDVTGRFMNLAETKNGYYVPGGTPSEGNFGAVVAKLLS